MNRGGTATLLVLDGRALAVTLCRVVTLPAVGHAVNETEIGLLRGHHVDLADREAALPSNTSERRRGASSLDDSLARSAHSRTGDTFLLVMLLVYQPHRHHNPLTPRLLKPAPAKLLLHEKPEKSNPPYFLKVPTSRFDQPKPSR